MKMNLLLIKAHQRQRSSGQATVELSICAVVLLMMVLAITDISIHVSKSTKLPAAARAGALLMTPSNNNLGVAVRPTTAIQEIIRAGALNQMDLHRDAQITVSYVQLVSNVPRITFQYIKAPNADAAVTSSAVYASRFGTVNTDVSTRVPAAVLSASGDWMVIVEVFYRADYITPLPRFLKMASSNNIIYENAIF